MKLWLMILHDCDDGVRTARAFATRDDAVRAIRAALLEVEENFEENADQDAVSAAMARWDKVLKGMTEGNDTLQTDWDSHAVFDLREAELE
jgi:hypothetical protein